MSLLSPISGAQSRVETCGIAVSFAHALIAVIRAIGRLSGISYVTTRDRFELKRPN